MSPWESFFSSRISRRRSPIIMAALFHSSIEKASKLSVWVMSSCLCKKAEGAVFPLLVEAMEDGVDDALDAEFVDEADHGARAAAHLHEAAFDDVGGAQFAPQVLRHVEEGKQVGQILLEFAHQGGISFLPVRLEDAKRPHGSGAIAGQVDGLRAVFDGGK